MQDFIEYDRVLKTITQTYLNLDETTLNLLIEVTKHRYPPILHKHT